MVRSLDEPFDGQVSGWNYGSPRALGWITDPDEIAKIRADPLADRILVVLRDLQADGLLPVGPRGVGYILLGRLVGGRQVIKEKKKYETTGLSQRQRNAVLAGFYDFQDVGDTLTALRRARLVHMSWVIDGRTEDFNPLVALNAEAVRQKVEEVAKRFGPDILAVGPVYTEWWVEAKGLARVVSNLLTPFGVSCYSGSGDIPLPAIVACARRIATALDDGKDVVICIVGDFDIDGLGNADRFIADAEAFLEHDGWEGLVDWRWVAPQPAHVTRWPDLRAAQEPGKTVGNKSIPWTLQGEALLRGGVLATIVTEEMDDILDAEAYETTKTTWTETHAPVIEQHIGTSWDDEDDGGGDDPDDDDPGGGVPPEPEPEPTPPTLSESVQASIAATVRKKALEAGFTEEELDAIGNEPEPDEGD